MSDHECGEICMAARKMKMKVERRMEAGKVAFVFADYMTGSLIAGQMKDTGKEALMSACENLRNYLNGTKAKSGMRG